MLIWVICSLEKVVATGDTIVGATLIFSRLKNNKVNKTNDCESITKNIVKILTDMAVRSEVMDTKGKKTNE